jgi:hypothetical protein
VIIQKSGLWVVALGLLVGCGSDPGPEMASATGDEARAAHVATWDGGQLTQSDYEHWLAVHGLEPEGEYATRLAVLSSLAEEAARRGAEREVDVQLAAEAARHRVLLPMLDQALDAEVEISDEEIETLRLERPEAFVRPRRIRMSGPVQALAAGRIRACRRGGTDAAVAR